MPNIGPLELVLVLFIMLVFLGPRRLPEVGRSLGAGMRQFREGISSHGADPALRAGQPEETSVRAPDDPHRLGG